MSFAARYEGACGAGDRIRPGEMIESYGGEFWHSACADVDREPMPRRPVCQGCFIEKPCECDDRANSILDRLGVGA